ncbi:MAG TPA: hypothetical protein VK464_11375 [Symbiobacteriaceae bacterium]|nr:hypothetical protein [Symbiobacteriaceae bacterium]
MHITLRLEGHIREFFPHLQRPLRIALSGSATVADALASAGVPPELPGSVLCGGVRVDLSHRPADGDELIALSPMSGG